ncbi:MAG: protein phosphatase 2C domain-containing protein, partial [Methylocella sp.]
MDCLENSPGDWLANARNDFGQRFARVLRQSWDRNVSDHLAAFPLESAAPEADLRKAYGTTVALALVFQGQVFAGTIGDSTVFLVRQEAGVPTAVDLLAGENGAGPGLTTDSLASSDAVYKWKHQTLPLDEVRMVMAATDGFADSLADPKGTLLALQ